MNFVEIHPNGVVLKIWAKPNSSRNEILGCYGDRLKISVQAVPEKGKANKELLKWLRKALALQSGQMELLSGETSQEKKIFLALSLEELKEKLKPFLNC